MMQERLEKLNSHIQVLNQLIERLTHHERGRRQTLQLVEEEQSSRISEESGEDAQSRKRKSRA